MDKNISKPDVRYQYILIFLVAVLIISTMAYSLYSSNRIAVKYVPLVDATMEIKYEVTAAHLWLEEIMTGDELVSLEVVDSHVQEALWYLNAMLEGGENPEGIFLPVNDPELRKKIRAAHGELINFREVLANKSINEIKSDMGSDVRHRHDYIFLNVISEIDDVETALQKRISEDMRLFRLIQALLIGSVALLFAFAGYLQYRHERERATYLEDLASSKKRAEEGENRLHTTLESMGDGVIVTDGAGNVDYMNPVASELTGWMNEEARGRPVGEVFNIVNEQTKKPVENPAALIMKDKRIVGIANDTELISKDRIRRPIADSGAPILDENGELSGIVIVFRDVTEQRRAENAVRESEERYRLFLGNFDGIVYRGEKLAAKPEMFIGSIQEMTGHSAEDFLSGYISWDHLVEPDDMPALLNAQQQLQAGDGHVSDITYRIRRKDSTVRHINDICRRVKVKTGKEHVLQGALFDVTVKKRLESELMRTQKFESAGIFAGGIAHDFNDKLTDIAHDVSEAKKSAKAGGKFFKKLESALRALEATRNLTRQLMVFSEGVKPVMNPIDLENCIRDTVNSALSGSNVMADFVLDRDLFTVEADEGQIAQVINSLAANALEAMPQGGSVMVIAENRIIGVNDGLPVPDGSYVSISIKDSGIGIAESHLSKIFDPFYTTKKKGSGLGLATAYTIAKRHGGHITARSNLSNGSTFTIYLPSSPAS